MIEFCVRWKLIKWKGSNIWLSDRPYNRFRGLTKNRFKEIETSWRNFFLFMLFDKLWIYPNIRSRFRFNCRKSIQHDTYDKQKTNKYIRLFSCRKFLSFNYYFQTLLKVTFFVTFIPKNTNLNCLRHIYNLFLIFKLLLMAFMHT